jgi:hypothetical protein
VNKKKALFVAYGGGHVNMILPVVKMLKQQPDWAVEVLGLTTAGPVLKQAGIACLGFADIVRNGDEAALEWGRRLSEGQSSDVVAHEETVAYLGLSYADLEATHGVDGAARLYAEKGRHVFLPLQSLQRLLAQLKPDIVIATNAPRAERAAIMAAREAGIPAICLVDLYPPKDGAWLKENSFADKICVLSETGKDMLVGNGRNADHIAVTGNPAFDRHYLFRAGAQSKDSENRKTVVGLASNILPGLPDGKIQREVFDRLRKLCAEKNYALAVRQHPNEAPWDDMGGAVDCRSMPIEEYLASLDMLITFPSTIALEAQIHGVRVGLLDFTSLSEACSYLFNGDFEAIRHVHDIDTLIVEPTHPAGGLQVGAASATSSVYKVITNIMEEGGGSD